MFGSAMYLIESDTNEPVLDTTTDSRAAWLFVIPVCDLYVVHWAGTRCRPAWVSVSAGQISCADGGV